MASSKWRTSWLSSWMCKRLHVLFLSLLKGGKYLDGGAGHVRLLATLARAKLGVREAGEVMNSHLGEGKRSSTLTWQRDEKPPTPGFAMLLAFRGLRGRMRPNTGMTLRWQTAAEQPDPPPKATWLRQQLTRGQELSASGVGAPIAGKGDQKEPRHHVSSTSAASILHQNETQLLACKKM